MWKDPLAESVAASAAARAASAAASTTTTMASRVVSSAEIKVARVRGRNTVTSSYAHYPLKLIWVPVSQRESAAATAAGGEAAWAYVVSHGGGSLAVDSQNVAVEVADGANAVVTTQSPGKVFKVGDGSGSGSGNAAAAAAAADIGQTTGSKRLERLGSDFCTQGEGGERRGSEARVRATIGTRGRGAGSCLFWLPDPLTPFAKASLSSSARFDLVGDGACLVALEWWASGRAAYTRGGSVGGEEGEEGEEGERWRFDNLRTSVRVRVKGRCVFRDRLLLRGNDMSSSAVTKATDAHAFACLVIVAPRGRASKGGGDAEVDKRAELVRRAGELALERYGTPRSPGAPREVPAGTMTSAFRFLEDKCEDEEGGDVSAYTGVALRVASPSLAECGRVVSKALQPLRDMIGEEQLKSKTDIWV